MKTTIQILHDIGLFYQNKNAGEIKKIIYLLKDVENLIEGSSFRRTKWFHSKTLFIIIIWKKKATSNTKIQQRLSSLYLNDVGTHRDGPFITHVAAVNLHPTEGTHWIVYNNQNFIDSYGLCPPWKPCKFIIKRKGHCLYSEYKIQRLRHKRDSDCAAFCSYIIYLTKVLGIYFKPAV